MLSIDYHLLNHDDGLVPIVGTGLERLETHRDFFFFFIYACCAYIYVFCAAFGREGRVQEFGNDIVRNASPLTIYIYAMYILLYIHTIFIYIYMRRAIDIFIIYARNISIFDHTNCIRKHRTPKSREYYNNNIMLCCTQEPSPSSINGFTH